MNVSMGVLPIDEDKKIRLKDNGFLFVHELSNNTGAKELLKSIDEELKELKGTLTFQSALHLWKNEASRRRIITFCSQLDKLLGGGIELQTITDFCGAPATGKTQISLQLCIDVQLPENFGGINGQAIFIDTNFSSSKQRFEDMAVACVEHCKWMQKKKKGLKSLPSVADLLNGIFVHKLTYGTLEEFLATITNLREALKSLPKVRLIIIDSFSKPFLLYCDDLQKRTSLIFEALNRLQNLAWEFNLAVVTTSQLTTILRPDNEYNVVPGLGQGFAHRVTHRVLLGIIKKSGNTRRAAQMLKSPSRPNVSAYFQISKAGIRDEGVES